MVYESIFTGVPLNVGKMLYVLKMLFWVGILVAVAWFVGRMYLWNMKAIVLERRGKQDHVIGIDIARVKKDKDGAKKLKLAKSKAMVALPDFEWVSHLKWGFMQKSVVFVEQYAHNSYRILDPQTVVDEKSAFRFVVTESDMSLLMSIRDQLKETYDWKDWLTKWGPLIINIVMFAVLIIMLIFVVNGVEKIVPAFNHAAEQFGVAADKLSECTVQPATSLGGVG